jgi:peptide/nickel transport system permease protein
MQLDLLWTDKCFLALLIACGLLVWRNFQKQHIRQALFDVFKRPLAIISSVVLVFFLSIGVLDSVHFRIDNTQKSLLDKLVAPLGEQYEKTYSAPFALHLYSKEMVITDSGQKQIYPQLKWVKAKTKKQRAQLIKSSILRALVISVFLFVAFYLMIFGLKQYRKKHSSEQDDANLKKATVVFYSTVFLCLFFAVVTYLLSRDFHILGTGKIGQDIFYYSIKSIRTGLIIGTLTTLFMLPFALLLGIVAGYFGGLADDVIQYIYTTLSSIPGVLLIAASVLSMQIFIANHPEYFTTLTQRADARLLALCIILGITSWTSLCRLLRAESLKIREIDYIQAAIGLGTRHYKIILKHILPNVMHIVLIAVVLDFSFLVLAEAVLSYVGVGVSPMTISWGNMINGARLELAREPIVWWPMLAAFFFMFVLVLSSNLFADAIRDVFDPRYHSR